MEMAGLLYSVSLLSKNLFRSNAGSDAIARIRPVVGSTTRAVPLVERVVAIADASSRSTTSCTAQSSVNTRSHARGVGEKPRTPRLIRFTGCANVLLQLSVSPFRYG